MEEQSEDLPTSGVVGSAYRPRDPRTKAKYNIFSRLLLCWVDPLFWIGCCRSLEQSDLYTHPSEADSEKLLKTFNRHWNYELERKSRGQTPRLYIVILKCFWWRILVLAVAMISQPLLVIGQSVLLGNLTVYFIIDTPTDSDTTCRSAYLYAFGIVLIALVLSILINHAFLIAYKAGMHSRITLSAAIYQKILTLSQVTIGRLSIGHVVNLASNDVHRLDMVFIYSQTTWTAPIIMAITTYFVYVELGWTAFLATGYFLLQLPLQVFFGRCFAYLRFKSAKVTDKRVRIMNEIISGIRVVKMYAWDYAFKKLIKTLRRKESDLILEGGIIRACGLGSVNIALTMAMFIVFSVYTATGGELSPRRVFITLSLLINLRLISVQWSVHNVLNMFEGWVALVRLQKFFELEELDQQDNEVKETVQEACVEVDNVSTSWSQDQENLVLNNVSFKVDKDYPLLAVVGQVGVGKSSLLQCLLGELKPLKGSVSIEGKMSYASQDAWVFSATLRENILFGQPYEPAWYNSVIEACALDKDIELFVNGDLTLVGERGVTLSGGQKARVNLARAIYHNADIFLLDDPLSAVDAPVARHIFDKCICGLLKDRLVILITHQVQFALQASKILVLKEGGTEVYGSLPELVAMGVDPNQLLGLITHQKEEEDKEQFSIREDQELEDEDQSKIDLLEEPNGIATAPSMMSLYSQLEDVAPSSTEQDQGPSFTQQQESRAHGTITFKTYYKFFRAGANIFILAAMVIIFVLGEGGIVVSDWWLSDWAICSQINVTLRLERNASVPSTCFLSTHQRITIYSACAASAILLSFTRAILFYFICVNASRVLHNRMFASVLRAPVRFFDTNPIGRILNRFSKDIGFLDDLLPYVFCEYILLFGRCVAVFVTIVVSIVWVLPLAAVLVAAFIFMRQYYLKTSRDVKRLEAIARSPVYSHISMTLQGLSTIRAFDKTGTALQLFHNYQNEHTQGWYLYLITARWFGMRIDMLNAVFLTVVVFVSLPLKTSLNPALVGLSLTYIISLAGMLQYVVRQSAEVESIMISAERVIDYCNLKPEAPLETVLPSNKPPPEWPDKGRITMKDVAFQYSSELPLVLKNLCFSIESSEKIGIVGRTGAGKSSLISVLYRLGEPHGAITIDGVDSKTIGLHDLRKKMSIIPQDPVLFSGTMHYNLDPFDEYTDAELWEALEQVQLKSAVQQLEGLLGGEVSEGGSNFSVGQRQLVCLARALLRKNKILVLDEATANVDLKTDEIIQQTIRQNFAECTVVTIAHRLNTIMDSDRILVMSKGQVKELDSPYNLLQNENSLFTKMVEKTGPSASRKLRQMALDAHLSRTKLVRSYL